MGMHYCQQGAVPPRPAFHRVYMHYMLRNGWQIQFLEPDLKTPLPLKLTFTSPEKIVEMFERWGVDRKLEDRSALEYGIARGRGSVWLNVSPEQYGVLRKAKKR